MRDHVFEGKVLTFVEELAQRAHNVSNPAYARDVQERFRRGIELYGDDDFERKDNLLEALFESPDVGVYLLLELQRQRPLMREEDWMEFQMMAVDAMTHTVAAHSIVNRMRRFREEVRP